MRNFNVLAAVSAALLMAGGVSAKEKPNEPKPRKICKSYQEPGRITPRRICRILPPADTAAENVERKAAGDAREAGDGSN
ncbi:MAG TPA: hypothetical protein VF574_17915 [Allosphingosinicella sp.]|jgi:hypothetical protein